MTRSFKLTALLLAMATFLGGPGFGQDPFGSSADPFGDTPSAPAAAPEPEVEETADDGETDPAVLAIREINPLTAEDRVWAVETLLNLGRADEAKRYLVQLLESGQSPPVMAALQKRFGSALFLRMIRREDLQPEGRILGFSVLDAAHQASRDPARLQGLIAQLTDPAVEVRHAAIVDLRAAGDAAARALVQTLADDGQADRHAAVVEALMRLEDVADGPLVAALQSPSSAVRVRALSALGQIRSRAALPFLLRPALAEGVAADEHEAASESIEAIVGARPSRADAEQFLQRQTLDYLHGKVSGELDDEGLLTLWFWNPDANTSEPLMLDRYAAAITLAAQLSSELTALAPGNAEYKRLFLTAMLQLTKTQVGLDKPLPSGQGSPVDKAAVEGVGAIEEVLEYALANDHRAAAIGALEVLAHVGDARLLESEDGRPRRVALALQHKDPKVRFAAVRTVIQWDPEWAYPGSSYLSESLAYFARSGGSRRTLIGHPRAEEAQTMVGMLNELGYQADTAQVGRDLFRKGVASPDYEMVLLSDVLDGPPVKELVQQLRREPRTANLPIGILSRKANFEAMQRFAATDPLTEAFPRAHDSNGVAFLVRRLLALNRDVALEDGTRIVRAAVVLDYLAKLAEHREKYAFYDVMAHQEAVKQALYHPPLTARAASVLGFLGSPDAQRSLITIASQRGRGLPQRQAAAAALAVAVDRHGLLLSRDEIMLQYDRYNQSVALDRDTQNVLGTILDTIEAPSRTKE